MKVIDLLNKMANGEELPKEIIYDGWHWYLQFETYMNHIVGKSLFGGYLIGHELLKKINDEIKVSGEINETQKPKKIEECKFNINDVFEDLNIVQVSQFTFGIVDKINEIIDKINELGEQNEK